MLIGSDRLYGCIEAGGTKFVCAVADSGRRWLSRTRIPTGHPDQTIGAMLDFMLKCQEQHGQLTSLGIASFGPIELDRSRSNWGSIVDTPKPNWSDVSLVAPLQNAFSIPIGLDTDVNAAALAEVEAGGRDGLVYVTVGTGIGGGAVFNGSPLHGLRHPEMGHLLPPRHPLDTVFAGCCPYHGACTEGLASGPAIIARWGRPLSELDADHPAHEIISWYLGHLAASLLAMLSPTSIVFGGGVMGTPGLLDKADDVPLTGDPPAIGLERRVQRIGRHEARSVQWSPRAPKLLRDHPIKPGRGAQFGRVAATMARPETIILPVAHDNMRSFQLAVYAKRVD